jgi:hypothetical protein
MQWSDDFTGSAGSLPSSDNWITLRNWMAQADTDERGSSTKLTSAPQCRAISPSGPHGFARLGLDLLPAAEAHRLLEQLPGSRVAAEPSAAGALVDRCARLPLALRITAELVNARPSRGLSELGRELSVEQDRLDLLRIDGDRQATVRAVYSWSYQQLTPRATPRSTLQHTRTAPETPGAASFVATDVIAVAVGLAGVRGAGPSGPPWSTRQRSGPLRVVSFIGVGCAHAICSPPRPRRCTRSGRSAETVATSLRDVLAAADAQLLQPLAVVVALATVLAAMTAL